MSQRLMLVALLAMGMGVSSDVFAREGTREADEVPAQKGDSFRDGRRRSYHDIKETEHTKYKKDKEADKRARRRAKRQEIQARYQEKTARSERQEPYRHKRMNSKAELNDQIDALSLKVESMEEALTHIVDYVLSDDQAAH